jgi:hypothetical protein
VDVPEVLQLLEKHTTPSGNISGVVINTKISGGTNLG